MKANVIFKKIPWLHRKSDGKAGRNQDPRAGHGHGAGPGGRGIRLLNRKASCDEHPLDRSSPSDPSRDTEVARAPQPLGKRERSSHHGGRKEKSTAVVAPLSCQSLDKNPCLLQPLSPDVPTGVADSEEASRATRAEDTHRHRCSHSLECGRPHLLRTQHDFPGS